MGRKARPSSINKRLGARIRVLRESQAMTQRELASRAELSTSALSMVELGERGASLAVLERLAKALSMKLTDLLGQVEASQPRAALSPLMLRIMERIRNADEGELRAVEHLLAALDEAVALAQRRSRKR